MDDWQRFKKEMHARYPEAKKEYERLNPRFQAISAQLLATSRRPTENPAELSD